ncbi:MAG TPA: hypothetical protein DEF35_04425 [Paenibacillus sp.]|uniref:hypothetical protein n=1 Tax=Paenibacillus TaxID=44249 RepID=UPI000BA1022E|nr:MULTISPECIES: hypothetical protein [Paenibacillus]OZQ60775.1 hypothetical protein CA599_29470 [Paenibacillus taichungensis]HBU80873.1 hypothetical protein [Paenibacillus sp.]
MKMPQNLVTAVKAYQTEYEKVIKATELHKGQTEKLQAELDETHALLAIAVDKTLDNPIEENLARESELQRRIVEIEMESKAANSRSDMVFSRSHAKLNELADAAIEIGRAESLKHFNDGFDAKVKAIEEAKYAYLTALTDFHTLRTDAWDIWKTAGDGTNSNRANNAQRPNFREITPFHRGDRQVLGVTELEISRAYRDGKIQWTSVAEGRAI